MTHPNSRLVLDIETVLDRVATARVGRNGPSAFVRPWLHRIVAVSTLAFAVDAPTGSFSAFDLRTALAADAADEISLLDFVDEALSRLGAEGLLISWNGSEHDLPLLEQRRLRHWLFERSTSQQLHERGASGHQDLMHAFRGGSERRWPALADVCASLGVPCDPQPPGRSGAAPDPFLAKGQTDVIATFVLHCWWAARTEQSSRLLASGWTAVADYLVEFAPTQAHLMQFATAPAALIARQQARSLSP